MTFDDDDCVRLGDVEPHQELSTSTMTNDVDPRTHTVRPSLNFGRLTSNEQCTAKSRTASGLRKTSPSMTELNCKIFSVDEKHESV